MPETRDAILNHLKSLYGDSEGAAAFERLNRIMDHHRAQSRQPPHGSALSERDAILITYADQLRETGTPPLQTLAAFCERHLAGLVSGIHLLPFYPSSSDDGFSVIDYRAIDEALGSWEDIHRLGRRFRLMFDAVINHASAGSDWFQAFLRDDPRYRDFFVTVEGAPDLSRVVRPRTHPLLTPFETASGRRQVWTTFSSDQIDLNYHSPDLLLEIIDILLYYAAQGAELIRLDAVAYLWKEIGTTCIHLPQTHHIIQLLRAVLDEVAPQVMLITETNVPHADNLSYFGDGTNEAQLVYNFALPPLLLHTIQTGSARALIAWAAGLRLPSDRTTFFNFLASHDGVGINPVRGILSAVEINSLVMGITRRGGLVSYKRDRDGGESPYELNVNYLDALSDPSGREDVTVLIDRFIAAHAIMFSLVGVPGIYFHSLFGSRGWPEGVAPGGMKRSLNRQKFAAGEFERDLTDPVSLRHRVFRRMARLLRARDAHPAFDPHGEAHVVDAGTGVFALWRGPSGTGGVLCLQNVSREVQCLNLDWGEMFGAAAGNLHDVITGRAVQHRDGQLALGPYQTLWLTPAGQNPESL
jgi:sucrose phosphorylase